MKVALLSGANSIHTARWANGLASRGVDVHLISAHPLAHELNSSVSLYLLPIQAPWGYLLSVHALKKLLAEIKPDLMNTHYATGYGLLAKLSNYKPSLLSVWGSDVYDFPEKSVLHRWLLKGNLRSATAVASTSHCMLRKTAETFTHPHVFVTPFGINVQTFSSRKLLDTPNNDNVQVIGTVKTLTETYGIDTLIKAFAKARQKIGDKVSLRLEITGGGPDLGKLQDLAESLGVVDFVSFHGSVEYDRVPEMLNRLDIYAALSRRESFGVTILEASACEKPVVVSDADGPAEVTLEGVTGFIVPKNDFDAATRVLLKLIQDPQLRTRLGKQGRAHVLDHYTWDKSLDIMLEAYRTTIGIHSSLK